MNPASARISASVRFSRSFMLSAVSGSSADDIKRLPRQPTPKRVGSSDVNRINSSDRRGQKPDRLSARNASIAPSTPTVPSNLPAFGMASMCDPVATAGSAGSVPAQRAKVLPTASSRMSSSASRHSALTYSRARRSTSLNTMRVTAGAGASENCASASSSRQRRLPSIVIASELEASELMPHYRSPRRSRALEARDMQFAVK